MTTLADRIKQVRTERGLSQQQLAQRAEVHYTNVGRYERGEAHPSAEILNRIAQALEVSPGYLMNGTLEEQADDQLSDEELLRQFKKIQLMPEEKKRLLKEFLDAFIFKQEIQQRLAG